MIDSPKLHIVAFNVPYPPDYGGVIEIYYKIKALSEAGIKIHLHCFHYGRDFTEKLGSYCESVHYYERQTGWLAQFSAMPYIVKSRNAPELLSNLISIDAPVLFEGLHTTYFINNESLKNRKLLIRAHNIEHEYYYHLAKCEKYIFPKLFFKIESLKLKRYEKALKDKILLAISKSDYEYFNQQNFNVFYLGPFHPSDSVNILPGYGSYILYHGNLEVQENIKALLFLTKNVFNRINFPVIVAGRNPGQEVIREVKKWNHIQLVTNPSDMQLKELIQNAHINILPTFQHTGIKLKLLSALFNGRHCLVNNEMVANTGLEELCIIRNSAEEFITEIEMLLKQPFLQEIVKKREEILYKNFSNRINAKTLINLFS